MDLEKYILSTICQYEDAAVKAIVDLRPDHFTGPNRKMFSLLKGLFQLKRTIDLHVFASQFQGQGGNPELATDTFHYCLDHTGDWQSAFDELKRVATYRRIDEDLRLIHEARRNQEDPEAIAAKATKAAADWIMQAEKRYMSGREIDEAKDEYGEPIKTGYPLYDEQIYKHGGNLKGQMKGVICRHKHGKTRSECWEVAQNLRQGHRVLYLTLEGKKSGITKNLKQILQSDWKKCRDNIFVVDATRDLDGLEAAITEAVLVDRIDKVVVDYIQLVRPNERYSGENEKINIATEAFRYLMVKHNFHCVVLSQSRKSNVNASVPKDAEGNPTMPRGWRHVPEVDDAYGSQALVNAATIIFVGFRPGQYEENIIASPLGPSTIGPNGGQVSIHSLFMQTAITREQPDFLHQWWWFIDSNEGLKNPRWVQ